MNDESIYQQDWLKFVKLLELEGYTPTDSGTLLALREQQIDDELRDLLGDDPTD